jgi:hypothetical protein
MICGAIAISFAEAPPSEQLSWRRAMERECSRYGLDPERVASIQQGEDPLSRDSSGRRWWEFLVMATAVGIFLWLASHAGRQHIAFNLGWMALLVTATLALLVFSATFLWKRTKFS